jgi:hypothetical protein
MVETIIRFIDANASANVNPGLCGPCGGRCCKQMPGGMFPADVDESLDPAKLHARVRELLQGGHYSIDSFVGNPFEYRRGVPKGTGYYLRPAVKGEEGSWSSESWGGACTFHTDTGCPLPDAERPTECRLLTPAPDDRCTFPEGWEGKRTVAQAWWPYREVLEALVREDAAAD